MVRQAIPIAARASWSMAGTSLTRAVPPSPLSDGDAEALTRAGSAVALLLLRRDEAVQLDLD